jgi:catechol 2,3-dioxygenase-like lactoylglutathione lyase family enzyme
MKLHFDCVFYYVRDLEAAIQFYSDLLGMSPTSQDAVARFNLDDVLIELVPSSDEAAMSGGGNARLCLRVDDIEQASEDLRARGIHRRLSAELLHRHGPRRTVRHLPQDSQ